MLLLCRPLSVVVVQALERENRELRQQIEELKESLSDKVGWMHMHCSTGCMVAEGDGDC